VISASAKLKSQFVAVDIAVTLARMRRGAISAAYMKAMTKRQMGPESEDADVRFASIGWKYYLVYVCTNCAAFVFFYLFCPETKGRSLEGIDEIFKKSGNVFASVRVAREMGPESEDADVRFAVEGKKGQDVETAEKM